MALASPPCSSLFPGPIYIPYGGFGRCLSSSNSSLPPIILLHGNADSVSPCGLRPYLRLRLLPLWLTLRAPVTIAYLQWHGCFQQHSKTRLAIITMRRKQRLWAISSVMWWRIWGSKVRKRLSLGIVWALLTVGLDALDYTNRWSR